MARSKTETLIKRVGHAIAERRRALGLTQEALGARLNLAVKNVQRVEAGGQNLTLTTLERIAAALETTAEAIVASSVTARTAERRSSEPRLLQSLRSAGFPVRPASTPGRRAPTAVPVLTLDAAAGLRGDPARLVEATAWIDLKRKFGSAKGQFIAAVTGHSMEPRVPDGAICLFGPPPPPPYRDELLLVAHGPVEETNVEGPIALKQLESRKLRNGRTRVTLRSLNPAYAPIVIDAVSEDDVRVIAVLVHVLVG